MLRSYGKEQKRLRSEKAKSLSVSDAPVGGVARGDQRVKKNPSYAGQKGLVGKMIDSSAATTALQNPRAQKKKNQKKPRIEERVGAE